VKYEYKGQLVAVKRDEHGWYGQISMGDHPHFVNTEGEIEKMEFAEYGSPLDQVKRCSFAFQEDLIAILTGVPPKKYPILHQPLY
jgi:hypothetical protein